MNALSTSSVSLLVSIGVRTIVGDVFGTLNLVPDKHENAGAIIRREITMGKLSQPDYASYSSLILIKKSCVHCVFDLGMDYDSLRGEGQEGKVRELVTYLERRTRIPELVKYCSQLRSNVNWIGPLRLGARLHQLKRLS